MNTYTADLCIVLYQHHCVQGAGSYLVTCIAEGVGGVTATALTAAGPRRLPAAHGAAVAGAAVEVAAAWALARDGVTLCRAGAVRRAGARWCGETRQVLVS